MFQKSNRSAMKVLGKFNRMLLEVQKLGTGEELLEIETEIMMS